jgi:hypothetical protein
MKTTHELRNFVPAIGLSLALAGTALAGCERPGNGPEPAPTSPPTVTVNGEQCVRLTGIVGLPRKSPKADEVSQEDILSHALIGNTGDSFGMSQLETQWVSTFNKKPSIRANVVVVEYHSPSDRNSSAIVPDEKITSNLTAPNRTQKGIFKLLAGRVEKAAAETQLEGHIDILNERDPKGVEEVFDTKIDPGDASTYLAYCGDPEDAMGL